MSEQRKQLYVKRSFQQTQILEVLLSTFIVLNLVVIIGYFMIDSMADIQDLKHNLAYVVTVIEILSFTWIYRHNLKVSHRIAGPIFNMERGLRNVASGDLSFTVHLRKKDNFHEVGEQMNQAVSVLREKISEAQRLAGLVRENSSANPELATQLVDALAFFQTEPNLDTDHDNIRDAETSKGSQND